MEETETTPRRLEAAAALLAEHLVGLLNAVKVESASLQLDAKASFAASMVVFVDIAIAESKESTSAATGFVMQVVQIYSDGTPSISTEVEVEGVSTELEAAEELAKEYRNTLEIRYEFKPLREIVE